MYITEDEKQYNNGHLIDVTGMRKQPYTITEVDNVNPLHYTKWKIPPNEYITANKLEWEQGNVIKYVTRYEDKAGEEDLRKAIKYIEMLIERKYNDQR